MSGAPLDHDRLSRLFARATELAPERRATFLDEACKGEPELRAEIESLLSHDSSPNQALEPGAFVAAPDEPPVTPSPTAIGPYRLLGVLGEGGMGIVYHAEQTRPLRREVALKLIRAGVASEQVVARFEAERQALALMNHPNIASVLDVGMTDAGQPYFTMEYVAGDPITIYCDEHRLPLRRRLELYAEVCDGLEHAHRRGIVHRDIKAGNVLVTEVDGDPAPRIIDFGVAKALDRPLTDRSLATRTGMLIGTPESMSPEQAVIGAREIDGRTDVYSLGVLLYELITGCRPLDVVRSGKVELDEKLRIIREVDPPPPSVALAGTQDRLERRARLCGVEPRGLVREIGSSLDWIAMQALEKEPARRYASPGELAADIRRHLAGQPVLAGRPSRVYLARRYVRRHRLELGIATGLILVLAVFATTVSLHAVGIARERDRANREAAVASQTSEFLASLFELPDAERSSASVESVRDLLDIGAAELLADPVTDPLVQARLLGTIGNVYRRLGRFERARPLLEQSLELRRSLLGGDHPQTLDASELLAMLDTNEGRYERSEERYLDILALRSREQGRDHAKTLKTASGLVKLYLFQGRDQEAEELGSQTLENQRRVLGEAHVDTLESMHTLALVYIFQGRNERAESLADAVLQIQRRDLGEDHPGTFRSMELLGGVYWKQGRNDEALALQTEVLEAQRRVLGEDHPSTLNTMSNLSNTYRNLSRLDEAEALQVKNLERTRRVYGADHPGTLSSMNNLAATYRFQRRYGEAESLYRETLSGMRRVLGDDHPTTLHTMRFFSYMYLEMGRPDDARPLSREVLDLGRRQAEGEHGNAYAKNGYAWDLLTCEPPDLQDPALALRFALEANELTGFEHFDHLDTLALAYYRNGDAAKAAESQLAALSFLPGEDRRRAGMEQSLSKYETALRRRP